MATEATTIRIGPGIEIPVAELTFEFVRASGPGGQNVNKVATAVQLRFDVAASTALSATVKERLRRLAGRRLTAAGILVIDARRFRSQEKNRRDVVVRFVELLRRAATPPRTRRATRPTAASRRRRIEEKRRRSRTKDTRRRPRPGDD